MLMLWLMIGAAVDFTEHVAPGMWHRYLELMLTGLHRRDDQAAALQPPPLDEQTLDTAMQTWSAPRERPGRRAD